MQDPRASPYRRYERPLAERRLPDGLNNRSSGEGSVLAAALRIRGQFSARCSPRWHCESLGGRLDLFGRSPSQKVRVHPSCDRR